MSNKVTINGTRFNLERDEDLLAANQTAQSLYAATAAELSRRGFVLNKKGSPVHLSTLTRDEFVFWMDGVMRMIREVSNGSPDYKKEFSAFVEHKIIADEIKRRNLAETYQQVL